MESSKEEKQVKPQPFDFGIKKFKRQLREAGASRSYVNRAAKLYKEKVYERVAEVKAKMEKEMLLNASDK